MTILRTFFFVEKLYPELIICIKILLDETFACQEKVQTKICDLYITAEMDLSENHLTLPWNILTNKNR